MSLRRVARVVGAVLAVLFLIICSTLVGLVLYLRSPAGSDRILNFAKETLARDFATSLTFSEGSIDVFSGLRFRDLKLSRHTPEQELDVAIQQLDLDYEVYFWKRHLDIHSLRLVRPVVHFKPIQKATTKNDSSERSLRATLDDLREALQTPPVTVTLHEFQLSAFSLHAPQIQVDAVDLDLKVNLQGGLLEGSGGFKIPLLNIPPHSLRNQQAHFDWRFGKDLSLNLDYRTEEIRSEAFLTRPVGLNWQIRSTLSPDLKETQLISNASLADLKIFSLEATIESALDDNASSPLKAQAKADVDLSSKLADLVKPLLFIKKIGSIQSRLDIGGEQERDGSLHLKIATQIANSNYGSWDMTSDLRLLQKPTKESSEKATSPALPPLRSEGTTEITSLGGAPVSRLPFTLRSPLRLRHEVDFISPRQFVNLKIDLPQVDLPGHGSSQGLRIEASLHSPRLASGDELRFEVQASQSGFQLTKPLLNGALSKVTGLRFQASGEIQKKQILSLREFKVSSAHPALTLHAQGDGDLGSRNLILNLENKVSFREPVSPLRGQSVRGEVSVPLRVAIVRGREISLDGGFHLEQFSWNRDSVKLSGISGRLPFSERLQWDGKSLRFSHLISPNPFERVDFERVRPLLQGSQSLLIRKIQWEDKSYGPLIGFFSIKQNMVSLHQFDLDLISGRAFGQMYFNAHPSSLEIGSLTRITNLDLHETLPKKFQARVPADDKKLSARSGFVLGLKRSSLDGRMDVTEVGGSQLIALLSVLDPTYEDEKLNKVRGLLQKGYPTELSLNFQDGYLDLDIALNILGLSNRQRLRHIPISSLVQKATESVVQTAEKGPLK